MMSVVGAEQEKIIFNTLITVKSVFILTVSTDIYRLICIWYFENMCLMDKWIQWDCSKMETIREVTFLHYKEVSFIQRFLNIL